MEVLITDRSTLAGIQKEFSSFYPFLMIVLYGRINRDTKIDSAQNIDSAELLSVYGSISHSLSVDVSGTKSIKEVKEEFKNAGFTVSILRKAGTLWIETSLTEDWTLHKQNKAGEEWGPE